MFDFYEQIELLVGSVVVKTIRLPTCTELGGSRLGNLVLYGDSERSSFADGGVIQINQSCWVG